MIHRKLKTLTANEFVKRLNARRREVEGAMTAIRKLEDQWIQEHCTVRIGDVIPVDKTEKGHTSFTVESVQVDIQSRVEGGASIGFIYSGVFKGDGIEDMKGKTRFVSSKTEG